MASPTYGVLKFNVDKASKGNPREIGIRRVLRNDFSEILFMFSMLIGVSYANEAKIKAMCKALQTLATSKWVVSHKVIIKNDSKNVVKWIRDPCSTP